MTTAEDEAYTLAADDFGFSGTDADDELASVRIVTLPSVGSLSLDGEPVIANQVVDIEGIDASSLTFTPVANGNGDKYASFEFKVSDGTIESVAAYSMTINVTPVNDPAAGEPTILGTAQVWATLTASTDEIADVDGLPGAFAYRWIQVDGMTETAIEDATSSTYTLSPAEEGKKIRLEVSFSDNGGTEETLISDAWPSGATVQPPDPGIELCDSGEGSLRLSGDGDRDDNEGRLEICADDDTAAGPPAHWGTVCDDFWTNREADVACRALGFAASEPLAGRFLRSKFGAGPRPHLVGRPAVRRRRDEPSRLHGLGGWPCPQHDRGAQLQKHRDRGCAVPPARGARDALHPGRVSLQPPKPRPAVPARFPGRGLGALQPDGCR